MLTDGYNITRVHGEPDIYLENNDFVKFLHNPGMVIEIIDYLGREKFPRGILVGRLGSKEDDIFVEHSKNIKISADDKRKELHFYEIINGAI
jgi:hypothetical protein